MVKRTDAGIFIFNEAEVLDFAGPYEVFSIAEDPDGNKLFNVKLIAEKNEFISARNGMRVIPDYSFDDGWIPEILIIPGGYGAEEIELRNEKVISWIKYMNERTGLLCSVCTGAFILAEAGLLDGLEAATHWIDSARLSADYPAVKKVYNAGFVDTGRIITCGGISSGITMALHVVERLCGKETAERTARRMEYNYNS